jgi:hypothetical protein
MPVQLWVRGTFPLCFCNDEFIVDTRLVEFLHLFENIAGLSLAGNNLRDIPWTESMTSITHLDLSDNNIKYIYDFALNAVKFPQLKALDLSKNMLFRLDIFTLPSLQLLNMSWKSIVKIGKEGAFLYENFSVTFPAIKYMYLNMQQGEQTVYVEQQIFEHPTLIELNLNTRRENMIRYEYAQTEQNASR